MTTPPTPSAPPLRPDWWSRNWKWFVPVLCLVLATGFAGFVFALLGLMKSSDAYQGAVFRINNSPAVAGALGSPVREGIFFTGNISINGSSGRADLAIPLSGPKGSATAYVLATKTLGHWHFDRLVVETAGTNKQIDLSETPATPGHSP